MSVVKEEKEKEKEKDKEDLEKAKKDFPPPQRFCLCLNP